MRLKIFLLLIAFAFITSIELFIRISYPYDLRSEFYLQNLSSNVLMQTLPIQQLHDTPLISLYYLHIQPPGLDIIRALLAALSPYHSGIPLEYFVDGWLYVIWAFLHAILAVLIFTWIRAATGSATIAGTAYIFWLLYPGALAMSTLLDGTMLSSFLTTWMLYELWRFSEKRGSELRITLTAIISFLTRTIFQWPFAFVLLATLWIAKVPTQSLFKIIIPLILVMFLFLGKQFFLFKTLSTTTFAGEHLLGIIQYYPTKADIAKYKSKLNYKYPEDAANHMTKYNTEKQVITNIIYSQIASERLSCYPVESMKGIEKSIIINSMQLLKPVSTYHDSFPFLKRLFWRDFYDFIFVKPFFIALIVAIAMWVYANHTNLRSAYPMLAPAVMAIFVLIVLLLSNRYEWTEADRLKFILEPTTYVFVIVQFALTFRRTIAKKQTPDEAIH